MTGDPRPLVIIPCGGKKAVRRSPARDLYTGGYFRACLRYALTLTAPDRVRILSAKHGLVRLSQPLDPYDLRMGQPGSVTVERVQAQAAEQGLVGERDVIVVAGGDYTRVALGVWPDAATPLAGVGGLGKQLQALKEWSTR